MPTSSPVYDEEQDQKYNPAELKKAEENPADHKAGTGDLYNPGTQDSSALKSSSSKNGAGSNQRNGSLYNSENGSASPLGKLGGKLKNLSGKKKFLLFGAGGGGVFFLAIGILLIMMLGHLKIVQTAEHIAVYQFARTTAQMAKNSK
jgi:hypothetical protein